MFTYLLTNKQTEKTHMRSHGKKPNGRTEVAREWARVGKAREEGGRIKSPCYHKYIIPALSDSRLRG